MSYRLLTKGEDGPLRITAKRPGGVLEHFRRA
jgi:hypothetical protein